MRPDGPRPEIVGPASGPSTPFPLRLSGPVISGFGRGSKELGIPTANMPAGGLRTADVDSGVYYGWAGLGRLPAGCSGEKDDTPAAEQELEYCRPEVYPMVMSIGWNPYYKNTVRSVEVHLLHTFPQPFYGAPLRLTILGFIRPEYDYVSKEGLIEDIRTDIEVAGRCLEREAYQVFRGEEWLVGEGKVGEEEKEKEG